jgi:hypothetical protein
MPKWFTFRGRRITTDRFLILHEAVEKALIDHLGLGYLHAHHPAHRHCLVISMLPPSSRSIVFDLVHAEFFLMPLRTCRGSFEEVSYRIARDSSQSA